MDQYDDTEYRITKRELLRRHRALLVLVESLLPALRMRERSKNTPKGLSMEFILDLCSFSQRMKRSR